MASQRPAECQRFDGGLVPLLQRCLAEQPGRVTAALSGPVEHYQTLRDDQGWGCGWRNIQMLASGLLAVDEGWRSALFGGVGYVPDIASLQAWLEHAWASGWDAEGASSLGRSMQASHKWIGTTEAAAILRSFGARALIVDFSESEPTPEEAHLRSVAGGGEVHPQVPLVWRTALRLPICHACCSACALHASTCATDRDGASCGVVQATCVGCGSSPITGARYASLALPDHQVCQACLPQAQAAGLGPFQRMRGIVYHKPQEAAAGAKPRPRFESLLDWVWRYFTQGAPPAALEGTVHLSGKPPLYFQHCGHSRTIIGIEKRTAPAPSRKRGRAAEPVTKNGSLPALWHAAGRADQSGGSTSADQADGASGSGSGSTSGSSDAGSSLLAQVPPASSSLRGGDGDGDSKRGAGAGQRGGSGGGGREVVSLLVLDPGTPTAALRRALLPGGQWQALLKRGVHTLRKPEYQLLYCAPGLASGLELQEGKQLFASERF